MKNITRTKYLIIGNSAAAVNAVEAIRGRDTSGALTLVSEEPHHTYSRPLISYLLGNKVDEERMSYRPPSFYESYGVQTFLGKRAVHLDPKAQTVTLDDQTAIRFDTLLLATGGTPFAPPIAGREGQGVFTFTTLDDAHRVKKCILDRKVKKAVVIGGGLIGLKVTEALLALGIEVTIVELADRILSATFDRTASGIIESALRRVGCSTITGNTVDQILAGEGDYVTGVILKDKSRIDCDLVIMAIGVRPRIDLVQGTGMKTNRGILVDEHLQTSLKNIYAAGDVIETYDLMADILRPIAILPNAAQQGKIAGLNMAGEKKKYRGGLAMNSVELAGVPTISVGLTDPSQLTGDTERQKEIEVLQYSQERDSLYKKIVLERNRIIGIILIGKIDRAGIYTGLIKDKVDITMFKDCLLRDDFGLLSLPREYRKHLVTGQGIEV
jgi:NAD(P)H-nitrite reductase large subunit